MTVMVLFSLTNPLNPGLGPFTRWGLKQPLRFSGWFLQAIHVPELDLTNSI